MNIPDPLTVNVAPSRGRRGFTLLEVLVSLGIIIGALAGIAALLPAAGSRLADATDIDRAGTMAANARSDLANRRLITRSLWSGTTPAVVFGEGLATLATTPPASTSIGSANLGGQSPGFTLQDSTVGGGGNAVCYGCMLSSTAVPAGPGSPVRMTTVVFRQAGPPMQGIVLSGSVGQPLTVTGTLSPTGAITAVTGTIAAAVRKQFLTGCSWVLVVTGTDRPPTMPVWAQIGSSWTAFAPGQTTGSPTGASSVMLTGNDYQGLFSGTTLRVYGFDGLLRLDERSVNLE